MMMFGFIGRSAVLSCPKQHGEQTATTKSIESHVLSAVLSCNVFMESNSRILLLTGLDGIALLIHSNSFHDFILPRFTPGWILHLIFADGCLCCVPSHKRYNDAEGGGEVSIDVSFCPR